MAERSILFTINYNGTDSALITNGINYTAAGIQAALLPILPAGTTVTVANFGGSERSEQQWLPGDVRLYTGHHQPARPAVVDELSAGLSGFFGETDKGGPVTDNQGGIVTPTGNAIPVVTAPISYTIPLRTPFVLTGSATDADGDTMLFSWEQNDRGGSAGTSLLNNTKVNGPLFGMFPKSAVVTDPLLYNPPGQNQLHDRPDACVFPDLQQILDNNTNADTGICPTGPIAPPVLDPGQGVLHGVPPPHPTMLASLVSTQARSRFTSVSPP